MKNKNNYFILFVLTILVAGGGLLLATSKFNSHEQEINLGDISCSSGKYLDEPWWDILGIAKSCKTCPKNHYCENNKKNQCSKYYSSGEGASYCYRTGCPGGQQLDSSKSTGCSDCPSGSISKDGDAYCTQCTGNKTSNADKTECVDIKVTSISLDKSSITIDKKSLDTITSTIYPSNAANRKVTWSSSDNSIVKVSANAAFSNNGNGGVNSTATIQPKKKGTATITVKTADGGYTASCTVTVVEEVDVKSVSLDKTTLTLNEGETDKLTATIKPADATNKRIVWTSSNEKIATVSEKGVVKGVKAGTATITATTGNGKKVTCKVTVK